MSYAALCDQMLETLRVQVDPRPADALAAEARVVVGCLHLSDERRRQLRRRIGTELLTTLEQHGLARRNGDLWVAVRDGDPRG